MNTLEIWKEYVGKLYTKVIDRVIMELRYKKCHKVTDKFEFVNLLRKEGNVVGRHKEMPGRTYEVIYQDDNEATVKCTYLCPYCNQDATAQITVYSNGFALLDSGGFFEPLECEHCNKTTNVRFWSNQRI